MNRELASVERLEGSFKIMEVIQKMMKSVIFDLDGALLDRDASVEQFISVQYERLTEHLLTRQ